MSSLQNMTDPTPQVEMHENHTKIVLKNIQRSFLPHSAFWVNVINTMYIYIEVFNLIYKLFRCERMPRSLLKINSRCTCQGM